MKLNNDCLAHMAIGRMDWLVVVDQKLVAADVRMVYTIQEHLLYDLLDRNKLVNDLQLDTMLLYRKLCRMDFHIFVQYMIYPMGNLD